jgi:phosphoribosylanthranilate isomerase
MTAVKIKICGFTRVGDVKVAARVGADMIGLNFWPGSKRRVDLEMAARLAQVTRDQSRVAEVVGVFVDPSDDEIAAADAAVGLDWIQLHGDESRERVAALGPRAFKAARVGSAADVERALEYPGEWLMLDARVPGYGGAGTSFDWDLAAPVARSGRRWILAGGLEPGNVAEAIARLAPTAVDVASGVEKSPGIKSGDAMRDFVRAARSRGGS